MIDAHCHLQDEKFNDVDKIIADAINAGVTAMVCSGTRKVNNRQVIELTEKYPEVWATVGIHPEEIDESEVSMIENLTSNSKVVGIGETGLDFYEGMKEENRKIQIELFETQLKIAKKSGLPVVIHNRGAGEEILSRLKIFEVTGMLHSFNGSLNYLKKCLDLGMYIGIGSVITFKNRDELREVVKSIPSERILLETDAPYSAPEPIRGTRNEPKNVRIVAEVLASIKGLTLEEIDAVTTENTYRLFTRMK